MDRIRNCGMAGAADRGAREDRFSEIDNARGGAQNMKRGSRKKTGDGAARRSPAALAAPASPASISIILPIGTIRQLAAPEIRDAFSEVLRQLSEAAGRLLLADVPALGEDRSCRAPVSKPSPLAPRSDDEDFRLTGDIIAVRKFVSARCEIGSYRERASSLLAEYEKWSETNGAQLQTQ